MSCVAHMPSPVGDLLLGATSEGVTCCYINGQQGYWELAEAGCPERPELPALRCALAWLERYFAGERPDASALPLAPQGTPFQHEVWRLIRDIPYGRTSSYGELADLVVLGRGGGRMAAQAVGAAVGKNPLSIFVPCHRVLAAGGKVGGYGGGLDKKLWLLAHEGVDTSEMVFPEEGRFAHGFDARAR